jgi:hypothetical protein
MGLKGNGLFLLPDDWDVEGRYSLAWGTLIVEVSLFTCWQLMLAVGWNVSESCHLGYWSVASLQRGTLDLL